MNHAQKTRERISDLSAGPSAVELARERSAARLEVEAAYAAARRLVYDRVPAGPVDRRALTSEQQGAVARLDAAEEHLKELRFAAHAAGRRHIHLG